MKVKMKNLANIDCWIFDLDNTLYPASTDLFAQVCEKMSSYISNTLDVDKAKADKIRYEYWQKYGTSLAGLMKNFKIDPCLLYTSPSPRDGLLSRMPSSA